jgi:tetratricopeptide (TPR) repeat protein
MIVWLVQSTEKTTDSIVNELQPEPPQVVVSVDAVSRTEEPVTTVRQKPIEEPQNEALTKNRQVRPRSPVSEEHCRALAVQGKSDQAFSCFEKLGHRGGIEGDVAQLEMARLALKLGRGQTGLEILEHHRARLAKSALRGEAAQLRVRVLYQLGMNLQALKESEAVLSAPWGPAAAVEMRWLRGRIYEERLGDCSRAIDEYLTLLGNPGPQADNAEFRRARCLEKVGRSLEATTAYQRYLKRIRPGNAEEARTALRRLGQ